MKLEQRIIKRFHRAVAQYGLLADGDKILVGLSGGKDSLCLLEMLGRQARIHRPRITVVAAHVRMENIQYETDTSYLQRFCDRLDVPLHVISAHFTERYGPSDDTTPAGDAPSAGRPKPACFICSWTRRKQLFRLAQELGCNKIALGHHQDDLIHTALMNLFFQSHFSTMPALLPMRKMPLAIIRPLCLETEADIRAYAEQQGYERQLKLCPNERDTYRTTIRRLYEQVEAMNPEARHSIWSALEREGRIDNKCAATPQ